MLCISQRVLIDTTKSKVTLNKEGVVALGNISRDRDNLEDIFKNQSILIDSLRKESLGFKKEADTLRYSVLTSLHAFEKSELEKSILKSQMGDKEELFEAKLKSKNGNFFKGLGIGAILGLILSLVVN